jgi:hypothetical protein
MGELITIATKVMLSGVLVLLAAVFLRQAWRIWWNQTLVLAPFNFLEAGKPSNESGEQFSRMIRADLVQLASLYNTGEVANAAAVPSADERDPTAPMELPTVFDTSFFDTIELKAYGIEFGTIFKSLRRQIESPSEITGNVTHQGDKYSVFVELKQPGRGSDSLQRWNVQYAKDVPEATRNVACRIFRFLASGASRSTRDAAIFRSVDDEDFCLFNHALATYDQFRLRKAVLTDDDGKKLLAEADGPIANLLRREVVTFPYVYKLAALVFYEQKKYIDAEGAVELYLGWLKKSARADKSAEMLRANIKSRKLQTSPAVSRLRPLQPGSSVGPLLAKGAGMICCIVKDAAGHRYILSAAQVFGSIVGAKIVQPAIRDGGTEADVVADLEQGTSTMAFARIHEDVLTDPRVLELGAIKGFESKPADEQAIVTYGFDGKRREGKVVSTGSSLQIPIDSGPGKSALLVENAIITSDISSGGEIGAPVMTTDGKLIGMIFATGGPTTLVLPIEPALKELNLELVK